MELPGIFVSPEQAPLDFGDLKRSTVLRTRERTGQPVWAATSADDNIRSLVSQISLPRASHTIVRASLDVLLKEVAPFKRQNQETMRDAGGIKALTTLLHEGLHAEVAEQPADDEGKRLHQEVVLYTLYVSCDSFIVRANSALASLQTIRQMKDSGAKSEVAVVDWSYW